MKAKILTFVRGLMNGTPPRFQSYLKSRILLLVTTLGIGVIPARADYEIVFKTGTNTNNTIAANTQVSTVVANGTDYVSGFTSSNSKAYYAGGAAGVKLGSGSAAGTLEFNIASNYQDNIIGIKVVSAKYGSDEGTLTLYNGSTQLKSGINPADGYTHTFDKATTVQSIKISTSKKRAYITSVTLITEEGGIIITADKVKNFAGSYTDYNWEAEGISGVMYAYRAGSSSPYLMQIKSPGYVYNTTKISGKITSIKMIQGGGTIRSWSIYAGEVALTKDNYTTNGTKIGETQQVGTSGTTWEFPENSNYPFFYITQSDGSTQISKIIINYGPAPECGTAPAVTNTSTASATSFECSGGITTIGDNCSIEDYGFVYNTAGAPTLENGTKVQVGTSYATAGTAFSKDVSAISFNCGTKYYVRTYVTNGYSTAYGSQSKTFETSPCFKDCFIDEVQGTEGFTGEGKEMVGSYNPADVQLDDKERATVGDCPTVHYHFVGWVTALHKSAPTDANIVNITGTATGTTYYAVWAKEAE